MNRKDTFTYDSQNALIKHEKPGDNKNIFGFLLEQFD